MYIITIFIFGVIILVINKIINSKSFHNISIKRSTDKVRVFIDEEFKVKTILENNKRLPISLAYVEEAFPATMKSTMIEMELSGEHYRYNTSKYTVWSYERRSKSVVMKATIRGVYTISMIKVTMGDMLGFFHQQREFKDNVQVIVYPKVEEFSKLKFNSTSYFGNIPMRRWLYKDNFLIKGIREYTTNDRMKDIHWSSTAKMNKLMVREYDFTMDRELMIILNVQGSDSMCSSVHEGEIEKAISLVASMAMQCSKESISVGFLTNAIIIKDDNFQTSIISPSENSLSLILEMCARIYNAKEKEFSQLLKDNLRNFNISRTYIILSYYLDKESMEILTSLALQGVSIYILDISIGLSIPKIQGIQKIDFKGGM